MILKVSEIFNPKKPLHHYIKWISSRRLKHYFKHISQNYIWNLYYNLNLYQESLDTLDLNKDLSH